MAPILDLRTIELGVTAALIAHYERYTQRKAQRAEWEAFVGSSHQPNSTDLGLVLAGQKPSSTLGGLTLDETAQWYDLSAKGVMADLEAAADSLLTPKESKTFDRLSRKRSMRKLNGNELGQMEILQFKRSKGISLTDSPDVSLPPDEQYVFDRLDERLTSARDAEIAVAVTKVKEASMPFERFVHTIRMGDAGARGLVQNIFGRQMYPESTVSALQGGLKALRDDKPAGLAYLLFITQLTSNQQISEGAYSPNPAIEPWMVIADQLIQPSAYRAKVPQSIANPAAENLLSMAQPFSPAYRRHAIKSDLPMPWRMDGVAWSVLSGHDLGEKARVGRLLMSKFVRSAYGLAHGADLRQSVYEFAQKEHIPGIRKSR